MREKTVIREKTEKVYNVRNGILGNFFNFGYYGHGAPANYCYTNENSLVQNNSKNEEAKKEEPKQKATREKWSTKETQVFVSVCKQNFVELQSYKAPDVCREISTKVSKVGNGNSVKQCKLKLRNMNASFHEAKLNNYKTGNEPNFPPFYEDFESILVVGTQLRFPKWRRAVVKHQLKTMKSL